MQNPYDFATYPYTQTGDTVTSGGSAVSTPPNTNLDTFNCIGLGSALLTADNSGGTIEPDLYSNNPVYQGYQHSMIRKSTPQIRDDAEDFGLMTGDFRPHKDDTDTSTSLEAPQATQPFTWIGDSTLRDIPWDADFHTRMRDTWINRFKMMQAFSWALNGVRESMSTRQPGDEEWKFGMRMGSLPHVDRAIQSITDYEVTEEMISNWCFAGTSGVNVDKMVKDHKDMTNAWDALTSSEGPVFKAVRECYVNFVDLSGLRLRFVTVGGTLYADYTHFMALNPIWPPNTPFPDIDM